MSEPSTQAIDVAVVGAGPIGLELAVNLKAAGVEHRIFDAGPIGNTIRWYPHEARFFSTAQRIAIAGVPLVTADQGKATREQYLAYLRAVVLQFDLHVDTYEKVESIHRDGDEFILRTQRAGGPRTHRARRVVLTIGDMHRPRRLDIPGEDLRHVSHYFTDPHIYFQQRLMVVGGRNSAVEAALRCHHAGAKVTLSYRRDSFDARSVKYWLLPELQWLIKSEQIAFLPLTEPIQINATYVTLRGPGGATLQAPADFVLLMTGYEMDASLLLNAGVELVGENRAPRLDEATMQTNVPGLYVAGTAAAGTQNRFVLFIENSHSHVVRIMRAITGRDPQHVNELGFTRLNEKTSQPGPAES
jgi:thioredoxin reductase (NADPH)